MRIESSKIGTKGKISIITDSNEVRDLISKALHNSEIIWDFTENLPDRDILKEQGLLVVDSRKLNYLQPQLEKLISEEEFKDLPILLILHHSDRLKSSWSGLFSDIIRLPHDGDILSLRIENYLKKERSSDRGFTDDEKFQVLVEQSVAGIYLFDKQKFIYVNQALANIFGYSPDEIINKLSPFDLIIEEDHRLLQTNIQKRLSGEVKSIVYDLRGRHKEGKTLYVRVYGTRITYQGKPAILGTLIDLSRVKKTQEELEISEHRYRTLAENITDYILVIQNRKIVYSNIACEHLSNTLKSGNPVENFEKIVISEYRKSISELIQGKSRSTIETPLKIELINSKKNRIRVEIKVVEIIWDENPAQLIIMNDITEKEEHLQQLEREKKFRQTILDTVKALIIVTDLNGRILNVNKTFTRLTGYSLSRISGQKFQNLTLNKENRSQFQKYLQVIQTEKQSLVFKLPLKTINNTETLIEWHSNLIFNNQGKAEYIVLAGIDISLREEALQLLMESEERYKALFNNSPEAIFLLEGEKIIDCNQASLSLFQRKRSDLIHHRITEFSYEGKSASAEKYLAHYLKLAMAKAVPPFEWSFQRADGRVFETEVMLTDITLRGKKYIQSIIRDISSEKKTQLEIQKTVTALRESESRFRSLVESMNDIVLLVDRDTTILDVFGRWVKHYDIEPSFFQKKKLTDILDEDAVRPHLQALSKAFQGENVLYEWEYHGNNHLYFSILLSPILDSRGKVVKVLVVARDIRELKKAQQELQASLEEKTALIQEIHHRVKNNLQIIISLLNIHNARVKLKSLNIILQDIISRIRSIAYVHELLYQTEDFNKINMVQYIKKLALSLLQTYGGGSRRIKVSFNLEPIVLDITLAIPCGLILNELINNAFKYAFPENRSGEIRISFKKKLQKDEVFYYLEVEDNGVGLPSREIFKQNQSLGFTLIKILGERQLNGKLKVSTKDGTTVSLLFKGEQ